MEHEIQQDEASQGPSSGPVYYAEFPEVESSKQGKLLCGNSVVTAIMASRAWCPSKDSDMSTELEKELYLYRLEVDREKVESVEGSGDLLVSIDDRKLKVVLVAKLRVYEYRWLGEVLGLEYYNKDRLFMGLYIESSEKLWSGLNFVPPGRSRFLMLRTDKEMATTTPVHLSGKARSERTVSDYQLLDLKSVIVPDTTPQLDSLFYNQVLESYRHGDPGKDIAIDEVKAVVIDLTSLYIDCLYASIDKVGNVAKKLNARTHLENIEEICSGEPYDYDILFPQKRRCIVAFYKRETMGDYHLESGILPPAF